MSKTVWLIFLQVLPFTDVVSYDIVSGSVIISYIKNDNALVD